MELKHVDVQEYYGETLSKTEDLQTTACCTIEAPPSHIRAALKKVHDEVQARYYGCGLTIPYNVEGCKILDLGSGSGRDSYIAAQLVGEKGQIVGVDMTDKQLDVANRHLDFHRRAFGYRSGNVSFLKGNIEKLDELDLDRNSFDIIISNCVINLATDKAKVLKDAFDLLKPGGEMYFSDVYADRRIPQNLQDHPTLWNECLSGALYWNDFLKLSKGAGFIDPRSVSSRPIAVENPELEELLGEIKFFSVTYRLFKIEGLEADCEDYGQSVLYNGTIPGCPSKFELDDHHTIEKDRMFLVCGNTYKMLKESRFEPHFEFFGSFNTHFGIFEGCGASMPFSDDETESESSGSCC